LKPEWWGSPLVQEEKYQGKHMKREEIIIIINSNNNNNNGGIYIRRVDLLIIL
jgi:hypothetical protein